MQQTHQKSFEVAVVGGGVCGLTCAIALQKAGVPVQLFEAAAAFGEIGAGIGVGPNAIRVLKQIGIWDAVMKKCTSADLGLQGFVYYNGIGEHKSPYQYPVELPQDEGLGIHRAAFLDALIGEIDPASCHFNKRCISVVESPSNPKRVLLSFLDGTTHEADVVLGADGIKSSVRKFLVGEGDNRVAFSNTVAYRGLISYADLKAAGFKIDVVDHPICFMGPSKHFIVFPISDAKIINVVAFSARYDIPIGAANLPEGASWVEPSTRDELKKVYKGWGPDVSILLDCMPEKPSKWSIHVLYPPLESYTKGRVALLGDAAHGMLPHMGAGAGQGLEDAFMLSRLLSHPDTNAENIEAVLQVYSEVRLPRAQMVWDGSVFAGRVYDGTGPHGQDWEKIGEDLSPELFTPVWRHDFDAEFAGVVSTLRERGAFSA
ncbi:FAD/NAD-P-binding domain-containing protein [Trametes versicolor FP-101664 SS1]|uniref:FAD/NAD-P-binding domain-containing protein n=1 Tax=Trametes versicolor (strain FP-101664) TaxID=717944 RepID=UPI00046214C1|nr:FAD/NAD-P-binding domain-containing protein [Trametes versicolor FP-101664 SS1]EIW63979.1 FAD/NAD-P-binding domain-containing protein [Trametes versicolor FP-101664 SS1]